jgi:signal transduction histidine kinase
MKKILHLFQNSTIKKKLMMMGMFVTFVTLLMTCSVFITYDVLSVRQSMVKELSLLIDVIGKRTAPALQYSQIEKAKDNLTDLKSKASVQLACLYTADGQKLTEFHQGQETLTCPIDAPNIISRFSGDFLSLSQEIFSSKGNRVGSIYVQADLREIKEHLLQFGLSITALIIVTLLIVYSITLAVQRIISSPILELTDAAKMVHTKGHYAIRVKRNYNDEVGILADTFNEMLNAVQQRDIELKNTNENLENRVKERTQDLEISKARAEAANQAKSEFLRNMSHEFRTPLHGMRNFSSFGIDGAESAERSTLKRYFEKIDQMTTRLTGLTEGIMEAAHMENGTGVFALAKHDIAKTCSEVIAEQQATIAKKGVNVILHEPEQPVKVIYDRNKIFQVLVNVLGNAVKFTPPGKNIVFDIYRDDKEFKVTVTDQGVGIPEAELEDIFKKFVQSSRTKTDAGGTGLGLNICKGIIAGHEGKIWAENNAEGGATLSFAIPLSLEAGHKIVKAN